jgi:hypothetical protein
VGCAFRKIGKPNDQIDRSNGYEPLEATSPIAIESSNPLLAVRIEPAIWASLADHQGPEGSAS